MNELISIRENKGKQVVSARELYNKLGLSNGQFSRWAKSNILDNPFSAENEDWVGFDIDVEGNKVRDYALVISFAKKIAMMSKSEIGDKIRDYFLECEKKSQLYIPQTYSEALMLAAKQAEEIENQQKQITTMKPKAEYFDEIVDRNGLTNFRDTARLFGVSEKALIFFLIDKKYIYRDRKGKLKPIAQYVGNYLELKEWAKGENAGTQTLVTAKGRDRFLKLINNVKL
jgi:phage antirepressor YoqD-like protein